MIKKLILLLLIALPVSVFAQKFGVVDEQAIISSLPDVKDVEAKLAEASKTYENELQKLTEEFNKKMTEFQALQKDTTTPESIKERRMQELQELDQKMQQFQNTAMEDLRRQQQQLMAPIQQKVIDAIKAVGQEGGYTLIFPMGVPYYQGTGVEDATNAVKAKLGIQ